MKKQLIGFLLVLTSLQAMAVGHPHNLFAARKQLKAKEMATLPALKSTVQSTRKILHEVKAGVETSWTIISLLQKMAR